MKIPENWAPRARPRTMRARAAMYAAIRRFFDERGVLEVDTPILSLAATVDPNIDSFVTRSGRWLQTSPEFAMKRLLAAGIGPIYQIARVFREEEQGPLHNPEFTLLEWYRPEWQYLHLMDEVCELLKTCGLAPALFERLSYREAFRRYGGIDPFTADLTELRAVCSSYLGELPVPAEIAVEAQRNFFLDLLMSAAVAPRLGASVPVFVHDFPASQAALARVRADTPPVAERFELFWRGVELANGFSELVDAAEQERRFREDSQRRELRGAQIPPYDTRLVAALASGLPPCAGVAIGLDRVLMLLLDLPQLGDTLTFDFERA